MRSELRLHNSLAGVLLAAEISSLDPYYCDTKEMGLESTTAYQANIGLTINSEAIHNTKYTVED